MKKVFDQTVRDIKREVNKKVLKVPGIEQKVLDATSNEPWGPHGSHLADIAQATRNYNEYQMIMTVLWKRINDTGKNWRHVYKALTVLEYLVAHGSERVIDEIKEHAYQISTLSDFQYIDSSGRDQGNNVRKKSQSLVSLVNDKERIQEVRQKALANRDKYRGASSTGGMYRPSSYSSPGRGYGDRYDDDRYGYRDDERNGYGRDREWGSRDDDRYGRGGDGRNGDPYGRDSDERYGRDGYRDDDYRRNRGNDDYQYGSRSRSSDRERDRSYEDDDRNSSRGAGGRADEPSPDERRHERRLSEPNHSAPPSYEEAVNDVQRQTPEDRDGGPTAAAPAPAPAPKTSSPSENMNEVQATTVAHAAASATNKEFGTFDEFDPRASASAAPPAPPAASPAEMDLFSAFSDSVAPNSLALVPVTTTTEPDASVDSGFGSTFVPLSSASAVLNQPSEDPFGDGPFMAVPSEGTVQPQRFAPTNNLSAQQQIFAPANNLAAQPQSLDAANSMVVQQHNFAPANNFVAQPQNYAPTNSFTSQPQTYATTNNFVGQPQNIAPTNAFVAQPQNFSPANNFAPQSQNFAPTTTFHSSTTSEASAPLQPANLGFGDTFHGITYVPSTVTNVQVPSATPDFAAAPQELAASQPSNGVAGNLPHMGVASPAASQGPEAFIVSQAALPAPTGPPAKAQIPKDKFETKSTVWADTLNRGLVNLNISGPKINPLADIGIDFDSINRMEKRKEKNSATPVTSTITMGKAMGSGSGIGRAGATVTRPPPNPMMGHGMGMGVGGGAAVGMGMGNVSGMGMGMGMGMGSYGTGMTQPMGMNMGMGMGMGMGMNMGVGQGVQMRPSTGMPPGPGMAGGYNPMMGTGGYAPQQPYGGYR